MSFPLAKKVMRFYILSFLMLFSFKFYGQSNKLICGDTNIHYKLASELDKEINHPQLIESTDSFHFRFRSGCRIVDVWTLDGNNYNGSITNYINHFIYHTENSGRKNSEIIFKNVQMDTTQARQVFNIFQPITLIPSDKSILGWKHGSFDGSSDIIEVQTPSIYCFKIYGNLYTQDSSILESKAILKFVDSLNSILNLNTLHQEFMSTLFSGTYSCSAPMTITIYRPWAIDSNMKKPYSSYLRSMADTLNKRLSDSLEKIIKSYGGLRCHANFFLKYSSSNQLSKITTEIKIKGIRGQLVFFGCKKKIRKALKKVNMDLMNSPGSYWIVLNYNEGHVQIFL